MKLHSNHLTRQMIETALRAAKAAGKVGQDVIFADFGSAGSRQRQRAWEINLAATDRNRGTAANSGTHGVGVRWAATHDEWGFFIANVLQLDPDAIFGPYQGLAYFNDKTANKYASTLADWRDDNGQGSSTRAGVLEEFLSRAVLTIALSEYELAALRLLVAAELGRHEMLARTFTTPWPTAMRAIAKQLDPYMDLEAASKVLVDRARANAAGGQ